VKTYLDPCPKCGEWPFRPFLRGMFYRSFRWRDVPAMLRAWWRREYWPTSTLICWGCKEIVGYE
jgi:hypothetical protein